METDVKIMLVALCASLAWSPAYAISTYNPTKIECEKLKDIVRKEGAVNLRWTSTMTPGVPRYGRYVRDTSFCRVPVESATGTLVPSLDKKSCRVATCRPHYPGDGSFFGRT